MKRRLRYLIYPSYLLAIVAAIVGAVVPFLLNFSGNPPDGVMCFESCGGFSGGYLLFFIIPFNLFCITLYVSRKKIKCGRSKAWVIPELIALLFIALTIIGAVLKILQALIKEFSTPPLNVYYSLPSLNVYYSLSPEQILGAIYITIIGLWTVGAYLLVWCGTPAKDAGSTRRKPLKGLLIFLLFMLMCGTVIASLLYLDDLTSRSERDAQKKKCDSVFIEFQKELASTTCRIDSDCSVDGLRARERERIREPYGTDLYFSQQMAINSRFYALETSNCGNLRLYCESGKCVPNR